MLSCNCLNVIVECETGDFLKVPDYSEYKITNEEKRDPFFTLDHYKCTKIPNIITRQVLMQDKKEVGDWHIFRCINCDIVTHAINKYKGPSWALFPTYLLTFQKIKELKSSKQYSKCFNIILPEKVDKSKLQEVDPSVLASLSCNGNFVQQFHQFKDIEKKACEERINEFAQLQYAIVENTIELESHFLEAMKWRIIEDKHKKLLENKLATSEPPDPPCCINWRLRDRENQEIDDPPPPLQTEWKNLRKSDSEEVFEMEDMDGFDNTAPPHSQSEDEASETEIGELADEGRGVRIIKKKSDPASIAKSLPINIPSFLSINRGNTSDDSDETDQQGNEKVDIAASIKALARSVHGEAVFGELPRPRFSSQI